MRLEVDGAPALAYTGGRPHGGNRPAIAFVHGAGLDHTVWILQSRWFAHHGHDVLALDLPGHGGSGGAPLPSIGEMADWTARALDAAGIERASVAGHSMGALVALELAARHPDRVRDAALLGVSVPMAVSDALLDAAAANDHAAIDMIVQWGHAAPSRLGGNPSPGMWMTGGGARLLERARPGVLHGDLLACARYADGLEAAARVRCPVHVILGGADVMAPPRGARALVDALDDVRVTELPGCGHMLMSERPDAVLDALAAPAATAATA